MPATEAFPLLVPSTGPSPSSRSSTPNTNDNGTRSRRRSSGLGGEIRAGDTSAPALATMDVIPQSPRSIKVGKMENLYVPCQISIYACADMYTWRCGLYPPPLPGAEDNAKGKNRADLSSARLRMSEIARSLPRNGARPAPSCSNSNAMPSNTPG